MKGFHRNPFAGIHARIVRELGKEAAARAIEEGKKTGARSRKSEAPRSYIDMAALEYARAIEERVHGPNLTP